MAGENARKVQTGTSIDYTPGSAVASGDVVVLTDTVGVALTPIAANELGSLEIDGVFEVPKDSATVFTQGDTAHWDPDASTTGEAVTASATGTTLMGRVVKAAGSGDTTVWIKINDV